MGILTDFIVATPEQIASAFPAWLPVAAEPVSRESTNPFTGEPIIVKDWPPAVPPPTQIDDAATLGNYGNLPHAEFKGITHTELGELAHLMIGADVNQVVSDIGIPALLDPRLSDETGLHLLPPYFVTALAEVEESQMCQWSERWGEVVGMHKREGTMVLSALVRLAQQSIATNANMYFWWSL